LKRGKDILVSISVSSQKVIGFLPLSSVALASRKIVSFHVGMCNSCMGKKIQNSNETSRCNFFACRYETKLVF